MGAETEKARLWKLQGRYFHRFLDDYPTFREGQLMRDFYQRLWERTMKKIDWMEEKIVKMTCELETLKVILNNFQGPIWMCEQLHWLKETFWLIQTSKPFISNKKLKAFHLSFSFQAEAKTISDLGTVWQRMFQKWPKR